MSNQNGNGQSTASSNGNGVILLIDDDPAILVPYEQILARLTYHPVIALSSVDLGFDYLFLAKIRQAALVVTDTHTGGRRNGVDLYNWLKENKPEIPCYVMSGDVLPKLRAAVKAIGDHFLEKPVKLETFLEVLKKHGLAMPSLLHPESS